MLRMTISRERGRSCTLCFETMEDLRAFVEFIEDLIQAVKEAEKP